MSSRHMNIVMIPFHDCKKWIVEGYRTRDAHLAEHFCRDNRVDKLLVINRPTSLAEMCVKHKSWKTSRLDPTISVVENGRDYELCRINEKIYCLDVFLKDVVRVLLERKKWWHTAYSTTSVVEIIKKIIHDLMGDDCVLLIENPVAVSIIDNVQYRLLAYDAIDNWMYHPQMRSLHEIVYSAYAAIEKKADIIFTVSKSLTKQFGRNQSVYWLPNGVDIEYFKPAISSTIPKTPVIGYIGKIQDRVDFELVERCLQEFPENRFVFIGPAYSQQKRIKELKREYKNITFLGDVPYPMLPAVMKQLDICVIPHRVDDLTNSMDPLKLYEYLAAGKPVVTTKVAGVEGISEYVLIADNNHEFVQNIRILCGRLSSHDIEADRIIETIPQSRTWDYISNIFIDRLEDMMTEDGDAEE